MVSPEVAAMMSGASAFARRHVLPIIAETPRVRKPIGSAAIFELDGHRLLVTAKHVIDELKKAEAIYGARACWGIPIDQSEGRWDTTEVWSLGNRVELRAEGVAKDVDVGVVFINDPEFLAKLEGKREFLRVADHVQMTAPDGNYFLYGFPGSQATVDEEHVHHRPFQFATGRYQGPKDEFTARFDPVVNVLLGFAEEATLDDGTQVPLLDALGLKGISGCPLWLVENPPDELWNPGRHMKVVGVQTGVEDGRFIVGTRWAVVLKAIREQLAKPST